MPHERAEPSPLFESASYVARELNVEQIPQVQRLFDANPEYFVIVSGRPAGPDEAAAEFAEMPPAHLPFTRRHFAGLFDRAETLQGVAVVVSDLSAPGVWHVALFLLATSRHGSGDAQEIYAALEAWAVHGGARWLRLGVVQDNPRAARFWARQGFAEVRVRASVDVGGRRTLVRVMVKPVASAGLDEYLAQVPRDRPDSSLP